MNNAMIGDIVDQDELINGERREGMFAGIYALIITPSLSLVVALFGWATDSHGYVASTGDEVVQQSADALLGVRIGMCLIPAIFLILAVIVIYFYPLHGERYEKLKADLKAY